MSTNETTYEQLFTRFESERLQQSGLYAAIDTGIAALNIGGSHDRSIQQQLGVTYRRLGHHDLSIHYLQAATKGAGTIEAAGINRDLAETYRAAGNYIRAGELIEAALKNLSANTEPAHFAVTLGFRARLRRVTGNLDGALSDLDIATTILRHADNRHFELYTTLDYASCLSLSHRSIGDIVLSKLVALRALQLAYGYGSRDHRIRAFALLLGGHRLEAATRRFWKAKP